MATPRKKQSGSRRRTPKFAYCSVPETQTREFSSGVTDMRARLIRRTEAKWTNGTVLRYYFFTSPAGWRGTSAEKTTVRRAFKAWKDVGIGLDFKEVDSPDEAEIRIGFQRGDGAWSYLGRAILNQGPTYRTMNFGWNIANDIDTAIHEIGHTLGFPHEHQNPHAGIVWNEEAVYDALAAPPNNWDRQTTHWNIIRKIDPADVQGSQWDPDSIMHYPFQAGLINEPAIYRTQDLVPAPGLSQRDKEWVRELYPPLDDKKNPLLDPFKFVRLRLEPSQQANFRVEPEATRRYTFSTFGTSDTVMVLFEDVNGSLRFHAGDDDSGYDRNARVETRLFAGRRYVLRLRLYYQFRSGNFGVMMW